MLNSCLLLWSFLMLPVLCQQEGRGDDLSDPWQTSNYLAYLNWNRQWQINNWFRFAQHVAKQNRGHLRDQAISYHQPDFNLKYKPQGLQFHAGAVDANLGLGADVGEIFTIPVVQHLQADQSVSGRKDSEASFFQHSSRSSKLLNKYQPQNKFKSGIKRTISRLNDEFRNLKDFLIDNDFKKSVEQVNESKRSKFNIGENVPVNSSRQIIIATSWRSGSSFLGDLLNHYPGTFYYFEPLHGFKRGRDTLRLRTKISVFESLLSCKFDKSHSGFLDQMKNSSISNRFKRCNFRLMNSYNFRLLNSCQDFKPKEELCLSQDYLNLVCPLYPIRLIKTVRMRVRATEELLRNADNLQVIVLVRDPRAVFSSRRSGHVQSWCNKEPCSDPRVSCQHLSDDIRASYELQEKYPGKIKLVRYEDLSLSPQETAHQLLEFLNLPWHEAIGDFIATHTKTDLKKRDTYGTIRNSTATVSAWKQSLSYQAVSLVQAECREPMADLGYRLVSNRAQLKSQEPELEKTADDVWPFKH